MRAKTDAQFHAVTYTYNNFGQITQRTWARSVSSNYTYDSTGALTGITYSDSTTPSVSYTYNRSGQISTIGDATTAGDSGSRTFHYGNTSCPIQVTAEELDSAFYGDRYITRLYDTSTAIGSSGSYGSYATGSLLGRPAGIEVGSSGSPASEVLQKYYRNSGGQFVGVHVQGATTSRDFIYSYLTNSDLISGYSDSASSFSVSRSYETSRNVLTSIQGSKGSTLESEFDYTHNSLYQTTSVVQSGNAFLAYGGTGGATFRQMSYNDRGELTADVAYLGGDTTNISQPLPDRNFSYGFDQAGNRSNSNYSGSPALQETYTVNSLNQYSARDNLSVPVSGTIANNSNANVVVATQTTTGGGETMVKAGRQGGYWAAEAIPPNDTSGNPVNLSSAGYFQTNFYGGWPNGNGTSNNYVNAVTTKPPILIPQKSQPMSYDNDGNMTSDGVWTFTYDAENRLIKMSAVLAMPTDPTAHVCLAFKYDYLGRRVEKQVGLYYPGSSTTTWTTDHRFLYDGWNLIADYKYDSSAGLSLHTTFTWGLDLSGDLTATGGVGALLEISRIDPSAGVKDYFPTYDGNGNVAAVVNSASSGSPAAVYEYSPFGETLQANVTDSDLGDNPFQFSTKYGDPETGLVYYGNRYYNPHFGRFINRDPIEEGGGLNLYGFVSNDPANSFDVLGDDDWDAFSDKRWAGIRDNEQQLQAGADGENIDTSGFMTDWESVGGDGSLGSGHLVDKGDPRDQGLQVNDSALKIGSNLAGLSTFDDAVPDMRPSGGYNGPDIGLAVAGALGYTPELSKGDDGKMPFAMVLAGDLKVITSDEELQARAEAAQRAADQAEQESEVASDQQRYYHSQSPLNSIEPYSRGAIAPNNALAGGGTTSPIDLYTSVGVNVSLTGFLGRAGRSGSIGITIISGPSGIYVQIAASDTILKGVGGALFGGTGYSIGGQNGPPELGLSTATSNNIQGGAGLGDVGSLSIDTTTTSVNVSPPINTGTVGLGGAAYGARGTTNTGAFTFPL